MKRETGAWPCSVARAADVFGDTWSMMILRDCMHGVTRFDEFQRSLQIARNTLSDRLTKLVERGILIKRFYQDNPPRYEYLLTDKGRDFRPVVVALYTWGTKHFAPEGASVVLVDAKTGKAADPVLVDRASGRPVDAERHVFVPGPAATERTKKRLEFKAAAKQERLASSKRAR